MDALDQMADNPPPFESDVVRDAPESVDALIVAYADARTERERLDDLGKRAQLQEDIAQARLFEWLEQHNLRSVQHPRGRFSLNDLAWPTVIDGNQVREWAEVHMPEILLPNASRLAVIVREALKGERDMPPGVEARFSRKITWRRQ